MDMHDDIMRYLEEKRPLIDRAIRELVPRKYDSQKAESSFGKPRFGYDLESINRSLAEPVWDLLDRGGKRWRPALFLLTAELFGGDPDALAPFSAIPELIHNGTLMVDDCEDLGELRRGEPCTHKRFGLDVAINTGNFMYYIPLLLLKERRRDLGEQAALRAYEAYAEEMINISVGQALDIWWHKGKASDVTEEQYLQMCAYKTGTLARLAARLGVILANGSREQEALMGRLAESLGIAFQIQDDVLSASGEEFGKKKGLGDDITEGKRSLLVIHFLNTASTEKRKELLSILDSHTRDHGKIRRALGLLEEGGSIEYAREFSRNMVKDAWADAGPRLPGGPAKKTIASLMDYAITRRI